MAQTVGIIEIWWKGVQYECVTGSTIKLPGYKNNTQVTGSTVQRYQNFAAGEVKATPVLKKGMKLSAFSADDEGELQVKCDTGQAFVLPDAFILDNPTLSDQGGKAPVTWNAGLFQEIVSS